MATDTGRHTYNMCTRIRNTRATDTGRHTSGTSAGADVPLVRLLGVRLPGRRLPVYLAHVLQIRAKKGS